VLFYTPFTSLNIKWVFRKSINGHTGRRKTIDRLDWYRRRRL